MPLQICYNCTVKVLLTSLLLLPISCLGSKLIKLYNLGASCSRNKIWISDQRSKDMNCIINGSFDIFEDICSASSQNNCRELAVSCVSSEND